MIHLVDTTLAPIFVQLGSSKFTNLTTSNGVCNCNFFLQVLGRAIAAGLALSWCMAGAVMGVLDGFGNWRSRCSMWPGAVK